MPTVNVMQYSRCGHPPAYRCPHDTYSLFPKQTAGMVNTVYTHRRIQDFVRGGRQGPLGPPGGGPRPSWPAPHYLGEQYFVGRGGGQGPLGPPLDPRMILVQALVSTYIAFLCWFPQIKHATLWPVTFNGMLPYVLLFIKYHSQD